MKFLKKFSNTAIPVSTVRNTIVLQLFTSNRVNRSGIAHNFNFIFLYSDFDWLSNIICFMIHSICQCFLQCRVRIVIDVISLRSVGMLNNFPLNIVITDISQSIFQLLIEWSLKGLLINFVSSKSLGKCHNINLRIWKKLLRLVREEH